MVLCRASLPSKYKLKKQEFDMSLVFSKVIAVLFLASSAALPVLAKDKKAPDPTSGASDPGVAFMACEGTGNKQMFLLQDFNQKTWTMARKNKKNETLNQTGSDADSYTLTSDSVTAILNVTEKTCSVTTKGGGTLKNVMVDTQSFK